MSPSCMLCGRHWRHLCGACRDQCWPAAATTTSTARTAGAAAGPSTAAGAAQESRPVPPAVLSTVLPVDGSCGAAAALQARLLCHLPVSAPWGAAPGRRPAIVSLEVSFLTTIVGHSPNVLLYAHQGHSSQKPEGKPRHLLAKLLCSSYPVCSNAHLLIACCHNIIMPCRLSTVSYQHRSAAAGPSSHACLRGARHPCNLSPVPYALSLAITAVLSRPMSQQTQAADSACRRYLWSNMPSPFSTPCSC